MASYDILPKEACPITVMHMVNASTFWVAEPSGQDMTKGRKDLEVLEQMLDEHYKRRAYSHLKPNYLAEEGELVAVKHPDTGRWHRAEVDSILNSAYGCVYNVFLVDYGQHLKIKSSLIRELPTTMIDLDYQAFQLILHGVVPTELSMDYDKMKMETIIAKSWSAAAVRHVKDLLEKSSQAFLMYRDNADKKIFGDLYLQLPDGIISLSKDLCAERFATIDRELPGVDAALRYMTEQQFQDVSSYVQSIAAHNVKASTIQRLPGGTSRKDLDETEEPIGRGIIRRQKVTTPSGLRDDSTEEERKPRCKESEISEPDIRHNSNISDVDIADDSTDKQSAKYESINKVDELLHLLEDSDEETELLTENPKEAAKFDGDNTEEHEIKHTESIARVEELLDLLELSDETAELLAENPKEAAESDLLEKGADKTKEHEIKHTESIAGVDELLDLLEPSDEKAELLAKNPKEAAKSDGDNMEEHVIKHTESIARADELLDLLEPSDEKVELPAESNHFTLKEIAKSDTLNLSERATEETKKHEIIRSEAIIRADELLELLESNDKTELPVEVVDPAMKDSAKFDELLSGSKEETGMKDVSLVEVGAESRLEVTESSRDNTSDNSAMTFTQLLRDKGVLQNTEKPSKSLQDYAEKSSAGSPRLSENEASKTSGLPADYKLPERTKAARLLLHGVTTLTPMQSLPEAQFPQEVHKALGRIGFKDPKRIQRYAWPAILRGLYTILVGPPKSGKTLSYIVPLVSFMLSPEDYKELPEGSGPLVLILCSGSKSAQMVYDSCCTLLQYIGRNDVQVQIAYGGGREHDLVVQLANGCDILVSTPHCFTRLLRCPLITNLDRVAHLVFDEVDILSERFLPEVKEVIAECKKVLSKRPKNSVPIQLVAVAEKWHPSVEQFAKNVSESFVVCISGYLEAAVYAKLKPTLHCLDDSSKIQVLLGILEDIKGTLKTLVVCTVLDQVESLCEILSAQNISVLKAHEKTSHYEMKDMMQHWKNSVPSLQPTLVCSDAVLSDLEIHDAACLIHYSLPSTKTMFGLRFSCLMDNYPNIFEPPNETDDKPDCVVHIFVDKSNNVKELPEVAQFLKRLSVPVAPEIQAQVKEIRYQREARKTSALCYNLKAFGKCLEKTTCPDRHVVVKELDKPDSIPLCTDVKLKILHVHEASRFAARVLEYTDAAGSVIPVEDHYFKINMALYKYYAEKAQNRIPHGVPKLGDICAVENKINVYQRAEVVEILKEDQKQIPQEVRVFFLDAGTYKDIKVYELLALPKQLKEPPPQSVEVFLCNVMPCDFDTHWNLTATERMKMWMEDIYDAEEEGKYITGKVALILGNTLWLHPMKCCIYLKNLNIEATEQRFDKDLLKYNLAVHNPFHLENLLKISDEAGIEIPSEKSVKDEEDAPRSVPIKSIKPLEPQWAYLESEGFQTADFIFAKSPEEFFVRRNDFCQCFQNLVREITKHPKDKPTGFKLEKGSYCLGKFPEDGVWYRTQVIEILEDDKVSLFFVDHGDYASVSMEDVAPITEKILSKLPFQAIECCLAGIKPIDEDTWSEDATDVLYDFTEECTTMFIKVCEVTEKAKHTGGKKYSVLFVHAATEEKIILNKLLVEKNLAVSVNSEMFEKTEELEALEFSDSNHNSDDGDSDFESEPQILKLSELETSQNSEDTVQNESLEEGDSCIGDMGSVEDEDEGYHVVMDNPFETLRLLLGIDKEQPTSVPALPAPPVCEADTVTTSVPALSTHPVCETDAVTTSVPALPAPSVCETDTVTTSVPAFTTPSVCEADAVTSDDLNVLPPPTRLTKSPEVLWNQDRNIIGIKIKIVGVVNYYLAWNINHIAFYTELENEKYEVKGKLFGPISEIWHSAKGLYVYIKMKKLVRDVAWARLFDTSQRLPWLKVDLDMKEMKTVVKEYASDTTASKTRTAKNLGNHVIVPELGMFSDDEDKVIHFEDEDDDDDSPVEIVDYDGPYDPYDPLN